jgi:hypothetical protein
MARAKRKSAKKKPATKKKKPATKKKKPATKKKKPAKKAASDGGSAVEKKVAALLKEYADGGIDNAWDVLRDMYELDQKLSKSSPLRPAFDKMYGEIETICRESSGPG